MSQRNADGDAKRPPSHLSDRQIGQAAVRGRKVAFTFFSRTVHEINGYVVGMDAYHWMVASPLPADGEYALNLVHKSRVDLIHLNSGETLADEPEQTRLAIEEVGSAFWRNCEKTYAGR